MAKPLLIGGAPVVTLRAEPVPGRSSFVEAVVLPGRGFMLLQATVALADGRRFDALVAPVLEEAARVLDGGPEDFAGNKAFSFGGAILAPYANRIRGRPLLIRGGGLLGGRGNRGGQQGEEGDLDVHLCVEFGVRTFRNSGSTIVVSQNTPTMANSVTASGSPSAGTSQSATTANAAKRASSPSPYPSHSRPGKSHTEKTQKPTACTSAPMLAPASTPARSCVPTHAVPTSATRTPAARQSSV